ncbi:MAG: ABC transporter permease [Patulibacter sp.]
MTTQSQIPTLERETRFGGGRDVAALVRDYGIVGAFALLFVVLAITTPNFLTSQNLINVLNQNAFVGIAACGATLVIIAGGFDLSVGAMFAVAGAIAAWAAVNVDPFVGLAAGIAVGALLGLLNGLLVTGIGLHSFLATLATGLAFSGVAVAVTGGFLIDASKESSFVWLGRGELIPGLPNPILVFALVAIGLGIVLSRTRMGRYVYAVGGNPEAARLSGVRVALVTAGTFVICGLTATIAGTVEVSKAGTGQAAPGGAGSLALDTIAAVVIGGTSIKGGQGAIWRTVLGVLLLALITNAFNILNLGPQYQDIFSAVIIVAAVALNSLAGRR